MAQSVKTNYIYNVLNTITQMVFPLVSFPYVTRIIGADGLGIIGFCNSFINYIILFTCLGIPIYGVREIARVRENKQNLSTTTFELLFLLITLSLFGYLVVAILCFTVPQLQSYLNVFLLLSSQVALTAMGLEWFYTGVEDFKYITIRAIIIRTIFIVLLFILVKSQDDLLLYAGLTVASTVGNNVFNIYRLRKYISIKDIDKIIFKPCRHIKGSLRLFALNLIKSIYCNLDALMLGLLASTVAVGYYSSTEKITKMVMGVTTSLSSVMIPRLSNIIRNGDFEEFGRLSKKSLSFTFVISIPLCVGLIVIAPVLIEVFCGHGFVDAVSTLQILSPIIVIIAISNVLGMQILYPQGKENIIILSCAIGALTHVVLNWIFIPIYSQDGAAFSTVVSELAVTFSMYVFGKKFFPCKVFNLGIIKSITASIILFFICSFVISLDFNIYIELIIVPLIGFLSYVLFMLICKDEIINEIILSVINKIRK